MLTSPSEADLFVKKGARAANVFYRFADTESAAQMQEIVTQMGSLVAERMSGAPSVHGDLCQLLTAGRHPGRAAVDGRRSKASFATHCDWGGTDPSDSTDGYLQVYDVPVRGFRRCEVARGDPVPGMGDEAFILTERQPADALHP